MNRIYLASARGDDPLAQCVCGCGVFVRAAADEPWRCEACNLTRSTADAVKAAIANAPRLVWRCSCGGVGWRVGLVGLECIACDRVVSFDVVFGAKP